MEDQQGRPPNPSITIDLQGLDQIDLEYVNVIQMNQDPYAFQIAFARYVQPLTMRVEDTEAFRAKVLQTGIPAQAVCCLLVAPSVLRDMVDVLQQQLTLYEQQFGPIPRYQQEQASREDKSNGN